MTARAHCWRRAWPAAVCGALLVTASAAATTIDLNDFYADPAVSVTADGRLAILGEDPLMNPVRLVNDPFVGDPAVIVAADALQLAFDYVFDEGPGNDDEFTAILFEASAGGGPVSGVLQTFTATASQSGTVVFDLSAHVGLSLGLYFELYDVSLSGLESTVRIAELRLVDTAVVPLPASIWLLLSCLGTLSARRRERVPGGSVRARASGVLRQAREPPA